MRTIYPGLLGCKGSLGYLFSFPVCDQKEEKDTRQQPQAGRGKGQGGEHQAWLSGNKREEINISRGGLKGARQGSVQL